MKLRKMSPVGNLNNDLDSVQFSDLITRDYTGSHENIYTVTFKWMILIIEHSYASSAYMKFSA